MRRLPLVCLLALAVLAANVSPASASPGVEFGIQDDAWLVDGPGTFQHRLDLVQGLGVSIVRYTIHWDQVAPTRPTRAIASRPCAA